jgi:hypothetical protein
VASQSETQTAAAVCRANRESQIVSNAPAIPEKSTKNETGGSCLQSKPREPDHVNFPVNPKRIYNKQGKRLPFTCFPLLASSHLQNEDWYLSIG